MTENLIPIKNEKVAEPSVTFNPTTGDNRNVPSSNPSNVTRTSQPPIRQPFNNSTPYYPPNLQRFPPRTPELQQRPSFPPPQLQDARLRFPSQRPPNAARPPGPFLQRPTSIAVKPFSNGDAYNKLNSEVEEKMNRQINEDIKNQQQDVERNFQRQYSVDPKPSPRAAVELQKSQSVIQGNYETTPVKRNDGNQNLMQNIRDDQKNNQNQIRDQSQIASKQAEEFLSKGQTNQSFATAQMATDCQERSNQQRKDTINIMDQETLRAPSRGPPELSKKKEDSLSQNKGYYDLSRSSSRGPPEPMISKEDSRPPTRNPLESMISKEDSRPPTRNPLESMISKEDSRPPTRSPLESMISKEDSRPPTRNPLESMISKEDSRPPTRSPLESMISKEDLRPPTRNPLESMKTKEESRPLNRGPFESSIQKDDIRPTVNVNPSRPLSRSSSRSHYTLEQENLQEKGVKFNTKEDNGKIENQGGKNETLIKTKPSASIIKIENNETARPKSFYRSDSFRKSMESPYLLNDADGDNDSGVDESTQGNETRKNETIHKPPKKNSKIPSPKSSATPTKEKSNISIRGSRSPSLKSPGDVSGATTPGSSENKKKVPMNKIQVGAAPSPNLKEVKSKIGSLSNASYKPGGGNVKIENVKLSFEAKPKIAAKNDNYVPHGGEKKIISQKLQWNAKSKIGSLENTTHKPKGGDKKIESMKLDFKDKAKPKVGSKDNIKYVPKGGDIKIETKKLEIKAQSKIGSLDNVKHKPGGGDKKIFDDKEYIRQMTGNSLTNSQQIEENDEIDLYENSHQYSLSARPIGRSVSGDFNELSTNISTPRLTRTFSLRRSLRKKTNENLPRPPWRY